MSGENEIGRTTKKQHLPRRKRFFTPLPKKLTGRRHRRLVLSPHTTLLGTGGRRSAAAEIRDFPYDMRGAAGTQSEKGNAGDRSSQVEDDGLFSCLKGDLVEFSGEVRNVGDISGRTEGHSDRLSEAPGDDLVR